jgi:iron(III) transport system ATP-binding protein
MSDEKLVIEEIYKRFDSVTAVNRVSLRIAESKLISLLGPSGCGKTTILRMIAGLENPDDGKISVDGVVLSDARRMVPPEKRNMGMVFQSYAVWPHMNVFDNVGYGLEIQKIPRPILGKRVNEMLELVGLGGYGDRYPSQLSGGQQQRVALARALVSEPSILLLDEPLSNLDAKLRENMRFEIRSLQQRLGITAIYVTHAQDEALAVSDEIVVMRDGEIMQRGTPEEIYNKPSSSFSAGFIGLANVFPVSVKEADASRQVIELTGGQRVAVSGFAGEWRRDDNPLLILRPENIQMLHIADSSVSGMGNQIDARVEKISFTGNIVNYFVAIPRVKNLCRCQSTPPVRFAVLDEVVLRFAPESCVLVGS